MPVPARPVVLLAACFTVLACSAEPPDEGGGAPVAARATITLEPPTMGIGDVAALEVAVITAPGHTPRPYRPPETVPGFWLLDAEALPIAKRGRRWIHRTRLRVRAREVGTAVWPPGQVEVEGPDGAIAALEIPGLRVEVVSVMPRFPDRVEPFGVRGAPATEGGAGIWIGAAIGVSITLAAVGLVVLARRRRAGSAVHGPEPAPSDAPWDAARATLALARQRSSADPMGAAHATAATLRRYMARRFRADTEARTTEELDAMTAPFGALSRWGPFVALLRGLDAVRFPPAASGGAAPQVDALIAEAEAFVTTTIPPESRG